MKELYSLAVVAMFFATSSISYAQEARPDYNAMSNFKLRKYLYDNGYIMSSGQHIKVGDQLTLGKGTMPNKSFAYIYEAATAWGSGTSADMKEKGNLPSAKSGKAATIKGFVADGTKKTGFTIMAVVQVGTLMNYWVEVENALEASEIILTQSKN